MNPLNCGSHSAYPAPLRSRAAAEWLGISEKQLRKLSREGLITAKKAGGIWMYSQDALADFAGVKFDSADSK